MTDLPQREDRNMARTGQCLCGAVRLTAAGLPEEFGGCHCKMCQRWSGGPFLAVTIAEADLRFEGSESIRSYQSSDWAERAWCDQCGSHLWYRVTASEDTTGGRHGEYEIPLGLFDDAGGTRMTREIFVDRKPGAYAFAGEHQRLTEAEVLALYAGGTAS